MKNGRTISEVLSTLRTQQDQKRDFVGHASALRLSETSQVFEVRPSDGSTLAMEMTDLFHHQLGASLGIPAKYYDTMRSEKPELLADNVNTWLADKDQSYMIRTFTQDSGSIARAFLSNRYRRIDNLDVATAILPVLAGKDSMEFVSCEVTENKFYLKMVNRALEQAIVPGDIVQSGLVISNSEVGLGAVTVQPLLYRLVCSNGMIVNDLSERKTHVGRSNRYNDDSFIVYTDETVEAEDRAFMLKLRDTAKAALEEARFLQSVDRLREAVGAPITGHVQEVVELTGKTYDLNQSEQESVLDYLIRGGDLSLYGLSNAITRTSQDVESYDRATVLEGIGWDVATMPAAQWHSFNN